MAQYKTEIVFTGDASDLESTLDSAEKKGSGLGSALGGVATVAGGFIVAQGLTALPGLMSSITSGAAALELEAQKVQTVFGDALPAVSGWAATAAHDMGLTTGEAEGLAAGFADLLIPMGFAQTDAAAMSTEVIGLSGALSEWSGGTKSAADVADILSKAMLGETDGLKSLGISLSAVEIETEMARLAQEGLEGENTAQTKAMAIQNLVMAKSTDAQTAYAEGADTAARKQAIATANINEAKEAIMLALLPAVTLLMGGVASLAAILAEDLLPILITVIETIVAGIEPALAGMAAGFELVMGFIEPFTTLLMDNLEPVLVGLAAALGVIAVVAIPPLLAMLAAWTIATWSQVTALAAQAIAFAAAYAPIVAIAALVAIAIGALYLAWESNFLGIQDITEQVIDAVVPYIEQGMALLQTAFGYVMEAWDTLWIGIQWVAENIIPPILDGIQLYFETWWAIIQAVFGYLQTAWDALWPAIQWVAETVIPPILDGVQLYFETWWGILQGIFGFLMTAWDTLWSGIQWVAENIVPPILSGVTTVIDTFRGLAEAAFTLLQSAWEGAWNAIDFAWTTIGEPLFGVIKLAIGFVKDRIKEQIELAQSAWETAWDVINAVWETVISPLYELIKTGIGLLVEGFETSLDTLETTWDTVWGALRSGIDAFINPIMAAIQPLADLIDTVKGGLGAIGGFLGGALGITERAFPMYRPDLAPDKQLLFLDDGGQLVAVPIDKDMQIYRPGESTSAPSAAVIAADPNATRPVGPPLVGSPGGGGSGGGAINYASTGSGIGGRSAGYVLGVIAPADARGEISGSLMAKVGRAKTLTIVNVGGDRWRISGGAANVLGVAFQWLLNHPDLTTRVKAGPNGERVPVSGFDYWTTSGPNGIEYRLEPYAEAGVADPVNDQIQAGGQGRSQQAPQPVAASTGGVSGGGTGGVTMVFNNATINAGSEGEAKRSAGDFGYLVGSEARAAGLV